MAKSFEVSTRESIPLPRSIREALIEVPESFGYVSHTRFSYGKKKRKITLKGGEQGVEEVWVPKKESVADDGTPYLTSDNHAFYIGKFFPKNRSTRIAELLGWADGMDYRRKTYEKDTEEEPKEHIYSEELIEATLSHLFAHLSDGEMAQVFVGPCLSDFINGKESTVDALSVDDEMALIRKIAKEKFPEFHKRLSVQKWDELPMHRDFFATMKECSDPSTGRCDTQKLFSLDNLGVEHGVTTLRIATTLACAAEESKDLALKLRSTVPGRVRLNDDNEEVSDAQNYGVIEIAIRLTEIFEGRNIHSGAERQAVYDDVIIEIVKGSQGRYAKVKALKELLKVFERVPFETLHVDNKINPPVLRKIRDSARNRIAMVALSLAAIVGGGMKAGQVHEQNEQATRQAQLQAAMDDSIEERMAGVTFYMDYKWPGNGKHHPEKFHYIVEKVLIHIQLRYNIPEDKLSEFKIALEDFVLTDIEGSTVCDLDKEIPMQIMLADEFVRKKKYLFVAKGIEIQYPYEHLESHVHLFDKTSAESFSEPSSVSVGFANPHPFNNPKLEKIGEFKTGQGYGSDHLYELVEYTDDNGTKHLLASIDNPYTFGGRIVTYNSATASEFVCHYMKERQLHEANKFWDQISHWGHLNPKYGTPQEEEYSVEDEDDWYRLKKLGVYTVYPFGLKFEIARYAHIMGPDAEDHISLIARRFGDTGPFTTTVAREAAYYFRKAQDKRWKHGNFCNKPEEQE